MPKPANVAFTPVETGDLSEIPPDAPAGTWEAICSIKKSKTSKDSFPMLILDWKLLEAHDEGHEDFLGKKVSDFCCFFPAGHAGERMAKTRLKLMCASLGIEVPAVKRLSSWDDLADFLAELDGRKAVIKTVVKEGKDGESRTNIIYPPPGDAGGDDGEEEDSEEEAPPPAKVVKLKKKTKA